MNEERRELMQQRSANSRRWSGLVLLAVGVLLLAQKMGAPVPGWLFTWQVLLIGFGLLMGIRKKFRDFSWLVPVLIGSIFLMADYYPELELRRYTLPIILILIGLLFVLRPKHRRFGNCGDAGNRWRERYRQENIVPGAASATSSAASSEEYLDVTSVLGGTKKTIFSKDFKGGEVTSFLGGTELNLSQADIKGRVVLELTQILGGTKLILPSHWDVKPELVSVFGGIEDKRELTAVIDPSKVLVLKGTSVFGGIEIRSY
jgi:predicted membrane protein